MNAPQKPKETRAQKLQRERDALLDALRDIRSCSEYEAHGIADATFEELGLSRWQE